MGSEMCIRDRLRAGADQSDGKSVKSSAVAATAGVDRSRAPINPMITGFLSLIVFLLWMGLANANSWGEKGLLPPLRQKVISEC